MSDTFGQENGLGIGPGVSACFQCQRPPREAEDKTTESLLNLGKAREQTPLADGDKAIQIAQALHCRAQTFLVVAVEARQRPGFEGPRITGIDTRQRIRRQHGDQVANFGVGLGGDTGPVQHEILMDARQRG